MFLRQLSKNSSRYIRSGPIGSETPQQVSVLLTGVADLCGKLTHRLNAI